MLKLLALYVVTAMLSWSPLSDHAKYETEAETSARYDATALDIAAVSLDEDEPALFPGDTSDALKGETAIQLAAVAFYEGRYWGWVDDGSCNKRAWRLEHSGRGWDYCDGGSAWSLWQIHPGFTNPKGEHKSGIVLAGDFWEHDADGVKGPDLVTDRRTAARVALHMLRKSLKLTKSLCGYTGETTKGCPKAKERRELARRYVLAHPFEPGSS